MEVKLLRGGSWRGNPRICRSASRNNYNPDNEFTTFGFRVVCEEEQEEPTDKVLRSGSWDDDPTYCCSASRTYYNPDGQGYDIGFRVVCDP